MGVIGALIVAQSATRRELRVAARFVIRDLVTVHGMVDKIAKVAKVQLTGGSGYNEWVAKKLSFFRHKLSPLFEVCMAQLMGVDTKVASCLTCFSMWYSRVQEYMARIEHTWQESDGPTPAMRELDQLPLALERSNEFAVCSAYLLQLQELPEGRRLYRRLQRRWWPTEDDKAVKALLKKCLEMRLGN
jgi:hypothetical protein